MSIASEQRQINLILQSSKGRLKEVSSKINSLGNQKASIDEDISILSHRLQVMKRQLEKKKQAFEVADSLYSQSSQAYQKLKQSTKALLTAFKKQDKKVTTMIKQSQKISREDEQY